jgi:repressor LexA
MNGMTAPAPLTSRQSQILSFLRDEARERGSVPSVREIMERFGFRSPATVASHLDLMEKKGVLRRQAGRARNIILSDVPGTGRSFHRSSPGWGERESGARTLMEIPLYGMIPAGLPSGQEQEQERSVGIDPSLLKLPPSARLFALEVRGDSMTGAGILDRDLVVLEIAQPNNRDIVAALLDGEVTLKRYLVVGGRPFLRAENPDYPDLIPARELLIQGVFRALLHTRLP